MEPNLDYYFEHVRRNDALFAQGWSKNAVRKAEKEKRIIRLRRGTYVDSNVWNQLKPWEQQLARIVAYHKANPTAIFSHISAAQLYGFAVPYSTDLHVYETVNNRGKVDGVVRHALLTKTTEIKKLENGLLATGPLTAVCDSARMLAPNKALMVADSALRAYMVDFQELKQTLLNSTGRNCRKMRYVAEHISTKSESAGESLTRFLLIDMGLKFTEQVELFINGRSYRADFKLDDYPILIEFDGRLKLTDYGATDAVLESERTREKVLQNAGWFVYRVGWQRVTQEPEVFRAELRQLIYAVRNYHRIE